MRNEEPAAREHRGPAPANTAWQDSQATDSVSILFGMQPRANSFEPVRQCGRRIGIIAATWALSACGGDRVTDPGGRHTVAVTVEVDLRNLSAIASLLVEVTAEDLSDTLTFDLGVDGNGAVGAIALPVGTDRTVTVRAFDAVGTETHRGSVTLDVVAGTRPAVVVALEPIAGGPSGSDTVAIAIAPQAAPPLLVGEETALTATAVTTSGDTLPLAITWSSEHPEIATVNDSGTVTAMAPGETAIVAAHGDWGSAVQLRVVGVRVNALPRTHPLVFGLQVETRPVAGVTVEYWTAGAAPLRVERPADSSGPVLLSRLLPNAAYQYVVRFAGADPDRPVEVKGAFLTDTLPTDLAAVAFTATGSTDALVMLELRRPTFQGFVAVDARGRVVWYHRTRGSSWGWARRANGNFVFLDTGDGLAEVTVEGEVVSSLPEAGGEVIHHDVIATPQNTLYFMTRHREIVDGVSWLGERIWEWSPDTDELVVRWNAFDFLSPTTDTTARSNPNDWLHFNSVHIGISGDVLVSSPFLNQIIALAPDFSAITWRLGGPNATIVPDSAATFDFQHTAAEIAADRVLVFDNRGGRDGTITYSRGLELALDSVAGSATTAWVFRAPNDNYASIISSARRMANGNTMVAFGPSDGWVGSLGPIEVYEITPSGDIAWHLVVEGPNHMYRATPFDGIAGESSTEP